MWISRSNDQVEARLVFEDAERVTIRVRRRGNTSIGTMINLAKFHFVERYSLKVSA